MQLGNGQFIAQATKIDTVTNFRQADIDAGGQGAPLACGFHSAYFGDAAKNLAVLNLGGIANITILAKDSAAQIIGYDTGPANTLLDSWAQQYLDQAYDDQGAWARSGQINQQLLVKLLAHEFFERAYPKSTGREDFNLAWLAAQLATLPPLKPVAVQASLVELTALSIADAIEKHSSIEQLIVCGGGVYNTYLIERLQAHLADTQIVSSNDYGLDPLLVEASAFAWLAHRRINKLAGNIPSVTGASDYLMLGDIARYR
jgi:anhydro-N-acetylmuramic acid kinase